ncbi:MAG: enoyl-CoA hydratase/isomerase family protein [Deltaproteobacteria bacterium]|nr:enoyl-CoA hydratase/isomerase family protein [Deltaproteobacteria bacterium]
MSVLQWDKEGTVAIITMSNAENRQNPVFVDTFLTILDDVEKDGSAGAVVVISDDGKHWSLGIDLPWVMEKIGAGKTAEVKTFLKRLNDLFIRLLTYPMPVIAAISGHSFGGGAIMACACDFRLMRSDRGFFCFPEIDVGIPFLPGMTAMMKRVFPGNILNHMVLTGSRLTAAELEKGGVVMKACPDGKTLREESLTFGGAFAKGRSIFSAIKKGMNKDVIAVIERDDPPFIESFGLLARP